MAPTIAVIIAPKVPLVVTLISENNQPPIIEPITPITIFPQIPNPLPLIILPASQPATKPINKNQIKLVSPILSTPYLLMHKVIRTVKLSSDCFPLFKDQIHRHKP